MDFAIKKRLRSDINDLFYNWDKTSVDSFQNYNTDRYQENYGTLAEGLYNAHCKLRISKSNEKVEYDHNENVNEFEPPIDDRIDLQPYNYTENKIELKWDTKSQYAYDVEYRKCRDIQWTRYDPSFNDLECKNDG